MEPHKSSAEAAPRQSASLPEVAPMAAPEIGALSPAEQHTVTHIERESAPSPHQSVAADPATIALPALPVPVPSVVSEDISVQPQSTAPAVAADDDLIEKEWVDKVKEVISKTKDNPHEREHSIKQLQIEYVKKRYGKVIGETGLEAA